MDRGSSLGTVSITTVEFDDRGGEFNYEDLTKNNTTREFL